MNRPWHIWLVFALGLGLALVALGWITARAVELDHRQVEAQRLATREENVRLALGRMEQILTALVVRESDRPYYHYQAFYPADRAYSSALEPVGRGEVYLPSPLLTDPLEDVWLHFQIGPAGAVSSPQVPTGPMRKLAEGGFVGPRQIETYAARLRQLEQRIGDVAVEAEIASQSSLSRYDAISERWRREDLDVAGTQQQAAPRQQQQEMNEREYRRRYENVKRSVQQNAPAVNPLLSAINVREGVTVPVWAGNDLLYVRRVTISGASQVQGCWFNLTSIREKLLSEVRDLLPAATLEPVREATEGPRMLASLPLRLVPGEVSAKPLGGPSPMEIALAIAWGCILIGAAAVALLLRGTVALSERRAAFVGAVTHELRTPLTTFRMYTEMLSSGMVRNGEKQRQYLATLLGESDRLTHLVDNVLTYARLERSGAGGRTETLTVGELLERTAERLVPRADKAGMTLVTDVDGATRLAEVRADVSAVEQILFNLVDNACKYAAASEDRRVHVHVVRGDRATVLRVCDHGPGIRREDVGKLFRPFCKSAHEAAHSAPGVGLGLTLSRRLAREMGGDLRTVTPHDGGACFELTLPNA